MRIFPCVLIALSAMILAGCQRPDPPVEPTMSRLVVQDYESFVDRTVTLLRERDFVPQFVDRQRGLIVTRPTVCRQWYEFWRDDPQDAYHVLQASLHTVHSIVTVRIDRSPEESTGTPASAQPAGEELSVSVEVEKSRYSTPERQVTTASGAIGIYSERIPTTEGLRKSTVALAHWVPLGRDGDYERHLLAAIVRREQGAAAPE